MATNNAWNSDYPTKDGELLIYSTTEERPVANQLTPGDGVNIINEAGGITIETNLSQKWEVITSITKTMDPGVNYIAANDTDKVVFTLPATCPVGSQMTVIARGNPGWKIEQNDGQVIHFGQKSTTSGTGGNLEYRRDFNTVTLVCITADTNFAVISAIGNINLDA